MEHCVLSALPEWRVKSVRIGAAMYNSVPYIWVMVVVVVVGGGGGGQLEELASFDIKGARVGGSFYGRP